MILSQSFNDNCSTNIEIVDILESSNLYCSKSWNREQAIKYVFNLHRGFAEVGFYIHFKDDHYIKEVIELPLSIGCQVGCKHCASGSSSETSNILENELIEMLGIVFKRNNLTTESSPIISFLGTGEAAFHKKLCLNLCQSLQSKYPNSQFIFGTSGVDPAFIYSLSQISSYASVKYLLVTFLTDNIIKLEKIIPKAKHKGFDSKELLRALMKTSKLNIRINYLLIDGFNDSLSDIKRFISWAMPIRDKIIVRLSMLNQTSTSMFNKIAPCKCSMAYQALLELKGNGFKAYLFSSRCDDKMNCGQLVYEKPTSALSAITIGSTWTGRAYGPSGQ